ncbi:MAG: hypothetical protein LBG52_05200, partial [Candidatus Peribacteria bacterium]|nr:hypothetical protein [Candidatus Peribacteria bacterium]
DILEEQFNNYAQSINKAKSDPRTLTELMTQFEKDQFIVTDNFERKFVAQKIEELKKLINTAQISSEKKYLYIGQLNTYKQKMQSGTQTIDDLKDEVIKAIGKQGREINPKKIHIWTPQSNTDREITGLVFDRQGNRSLNTKTQ